MPKEEWDVEGDDELAANTPPPAVTAALAKAGDGQPAKPAASVFRNTSTPTPAETHAENQLPPVVSQEKPVDFGKNFPAEFDENFPSELKDLPKCYEILRQVRALPETSRNGHSDARKVKEKRRREALISAHISKLSNPSSIIHIEANGQAEAQKNHAALIKRERMEAKAREDYLLKEFLNDFDKQAATIVAQAKALTELQAANAALKTENETLKKK